MTAINSTTDNSDIVDIGLRTTAAAEKKPKDKLDQSDFLRLLTTQLKNQDPLKPVENEAFVAQMAQFSSVAGISEMNESMKNMITQLEQGRVATATSYVGKTVLVPGSIVTPATTGGFAGAIDFPEGTSDVQVEIVDRTGAVIRHIGYSGDVSGLTDFHWDGRDDSGAAVAIEPVQVRAYALVGNKREEVATNLYGRVNSVHVPAAGGQLTLDIQGAGEVDFSKVIKISG